MNLKGSITAGWFKNLQKWCFLIFEKMGSKGSKPSESVGSKWVQMGFMGSKWSSIIKPCKAASKSSVMFLDKNNMVRF